MRNRYRVLMEIEFEADSEAVTVAALRTIDDMGGVRRVGDPDAEPPFSPELAIASNPQMGLRAMFDFALAAVTSGIDGATIVNAPPATLQVDQID